MMYLYLGLLSATVGLFIATHIYQAKRAKRPLMCPRKNDCTKVVTGRYSKTLGVPNETLGVGYYVILAGFFASVLAAPILDTEILRLAVVIGAIVGLLFSFYLLYVQGIALRAWCAWCLGSTVATVMLASAASGWIGNTPDMYSTPHAVDMAPAVHVVQ